MSNPARELETDDGPRRFEEQLKKLVKHKPVDKMLGRG
jgi:hypothetical protein